MEVLLVSYTGNCLHKCMATFEVSPILTLILIFRLLPLSTTTDGLDVVDKIEAVGSQSGATASPVKVKASGEITE